MKLYRFREFIDHNIVDLRENYIGSSLGIIMDDPNEMRACIGDYSINSKEVITKEDIERFINKTQKHCLNNYFISSFTLDNPYINKKMWDKYANEGKGYCLVYNSESIENSYKYQMKTNNNFEYMFEPCEYDANNRVDIYVFLQDLITIIETFDNESDRDKEIEKKIDNHEWDCILKTMFHKTGKFVESTEYRLIMKKHIHSKIPYDHILKARPFKIIICKRLNINQIVTLVRIAKKNNIEIEYFEY